jgi:hypothetical protein
MSALPATTMEQRNSGAAADGKISAPSAGRNKALIVDVLAPKLAALRGGGTAGGAAPDTVLRLLEVAPGTGEHASLLCQTLPALHILPVEPDTSVHASIAAWSKDVPAGGGSQVHAALDTPIEALSLADLPPAFLPQGQGTVHAMLCINMTHISPYACTEGLFSAAGQLLDEAGLLFTYGPYSQGGELAPSNAAFHASLQARDPAWGVRDVQQVADTAAGHGLRLVETLSMPANNLLLVFART